MMGTQERQGLFSASVTYLSRRHKRCQALFSMKKMTKSPKSKKIVNFLGYCFFCAIMYSITKRKAPEQR
jgi:hypothetical protein